MEHVAGAQEDWSTVDYGSGEGDASVMIGTAEQLSVAGANMTLDIAEQGEYQFVFDASDLNNVTLKVLNAEMFAQTRLDFGCRCNARHRDSIATPL